MGSLMSKKRDRKQSDIHHEDIEIVDESAFDEAGEAQETKQFKKMQKRTVPDNGTPDETADVETEAAADVQAAGTNAEEAESCSDEEETFFEEDDLEEEDFEEDDLEEEGFEEDGLEDDDLGEELEEEDTGSIEDTIHILMAFPYCKPAHSVTVQIQFRDLLRMCDTDIFIDPALINAKEHLMRIDRIRKRVQSFHLIFTAFQPARRALHRSSDILFFRHARRTFVKSHRNRGGKI